MAVEHGNDIEKSGTVAHVEDPSATKSSNASSAVANIPEDTVEVTFKTWIVIFVSQLLHRLPYVDCLKYL